MARQPTVEPELEDLQASRRRQLQAWMPVMCVVVRLMHPALQLTVRLRDRRLYRFYNLEKWSQRAFGRGDLTGADGLAREYLELAEQFAEDWNFGNAIDHGNQLLGLVCLERGDVVRAKEHLRRAGDTPGSPQLNSYGPRMVLARKLVEAGETEVVLEYLDQVGRFWGNFDEATVSAIPGYAEQKKQKRKLLKWWKQYVKRGEVPDHPQWRSSS